MYTRQDQEMIKLLQILKFGCDLATNEINKNLDKTIKTILKYF